MTNFTLNQYQDALIEAQTDRDLQKTITEIKQKLTGLRIHKDMLWDIYFGHIKESSDAMQSWSSGGDLAAWAKSQAEMTKAATQYKAAQTTYNAHCVVLDSLYDIIMDKNNYRADENIAWLKQQIADFPSAEATECQGS